MTDANKQAGEAAPTDPLNSDAAMPFAMDTLSRIPKADLEAHLTAVLVVFWGALWGTFGTEYAREFIEAQLRGMEGASDRFTPPRTQ
jgi:hypothetical protein